MTLHLGTTATGEPFTLPIEASTTAFAIVGRRGSGKTNTAVVMVEEMVRAGLPVCVLDVLGVWHGLRSNAEGDGPGLPVTILGGAHGDLPIEPTSGALIAGLVVDRPGAYVIDLSSFASKAEEDRFAGDFAHNLYRLKANNRSALCLVVDEADNFAPQNPQPGQQKMLGAFNDISRRGRAFGLAPIVITQRPAVINKNVLSQCEVMIAHQVTAPQDRDALKAWAQGNATLEQVTTFIHSLASLKTGEAWFWSPAWLEMFERISVRHRQTFDSSATPKPGEIRVEPQVLAPVDLEDLRARMAATVERIEADDPKKLKAQIGQLNKELAAAKAAVGAVAQPCDHEAELAQLRSFLADVQEERNLIYGERNELHQRIVRAQEALGWPEGPEVEPMLQSDVQRGPETSLRAAVARSSGDNHQTARGAQRRPADVRRSTSPAVGGGSEPNGSPTTVILTAPRQKILDAIAAFEPIGLTSINKSVVAAYAGVSPTSGGYFNNLGALRTLGLIEYPSGGYVGLTEAGRAQAQPTETISNVRELHERWLSLLPAPRAKIVQALIEISPNDIDKDELAERIGVSATSGGYFNNLGGLRTLGLVDYPAPKRVVATALLFPEGIPS